MNQLRPAIPQLATERKPCFVSRMPRRKSPLRDSQAANNKMARSVKPKSRQFFAFIAYCVAGNCLTNACPAPHNNQDSTAGRPVVLAGGVPSPAGQFGMTRKTVGPTLLDAAGNFTGGVLTICRSCGVPVLGGAGRFCASGDVVLFCLLFVMPEMVSPNGFADPAATSPQLVQAYPQACADGSARPAVLPPSVARVIPDRSFSRLLSDGLEPSIAPPDRPACWSRSPPGRLISDREWPQWNSFGRPWVGW
jgi:hypothetical protein